MNCELLNLREVAGVIFSCLGWLYTHYFQKGWVFTTSGLIWHMHISLSLQAQCVWPVCLKCLLSKYFYRSYLTLNVAHVSLNGMALDTLCYQFNAQIPCIFEVCAQGKVNIYIFSVISIKPHWNCVFLLFSKCTSEKVNMDWQLFRLKWNSIKARRSVL